MLAASETFRPKARTTDLVVEEMGDETLVYDSENRSAYLLAGPTLKIWHLCDGERRNTDIVAALDGPDASLILVDGTIAELEALNLIEQPGPLAASQTPSALSRRALLKKAVGTSAFLGATIVTLDVPMAQSIISAVCAPNNGATGDRFLPCQAICENAIDVNTNNCRATVVQFFDQDFRCLDRFTPPAMCDEERQDRTRQLPAKLLSI